jgi:hypothetical protein
MSANIATQLFGRPDWTYVNVVRGPVIGPQPRLAQGTGRTGAPTGGTGAQLPGYLADNDYAPNLYSYAPTSRDDFDLQPPRTINVGSDGRELVGTYQPHDATPGQRFFHHMRRAAEWQDRTFPPNFRNLVEWQQVQKYRVLSATLSARPLPQENYFLGYTVDPQVQAKIGQSNLGYMGSQ